MKHLYLASLTLFLGGCLLSGCTLNGDKPFSGRLLSNTSCKQEVKSGTAYSRSATTCVEYTYDKENHRLVMKHINAGFNCCPKKLYCHVSLEGNTILIQEKEKTAGCKCLCLYDLEVEVSGVEAKSYHVKFIEPYVGEQDPLAFDIDLANTPSGKCYIPRAQYPWGEE